MPCWGMASIAEPMETEESGEEASTHPASREGADAPRPSDTAGHAFAGRTAVSCSAGCLLGVGPAMERPELWMAADRARATLEGSLEVGTPVLGVVVGSCSVRTPAMTGVAGRMLEMPRPVGVTAEARATER